MYYFVVSSAGRGNADVFERNRLRRTVSSASNVLEVNQTGLEVTEDIRALTKACKVLTDPGHPLHWESELLHSGRRYRCSTGRKGVAPNHLSSQRQ